MKPARIPERGAFLLSLLLLTGGALSPIEAPASLAVENLRCEYRVDPVGLDVTRPRLSWTLVSEERGQRQVGYEILAASSPESLGKDTGDLWSTGRIDSDQTIHLVYRGKPLTSRMRVWWKVRVWDQAGRVSRWSLPASWTMGLLNSSDWRASWIADPVTVTNARPRGPLNGFHSQLTTNAADKKWVVMDLGQPRRFDAVRLFPARPYDWPDTPGFLFPLRYRIEVSRQSDLADAQVIVDRTASDEPNPATNAPLLRFPATTAQFVRLTVTRLRQRDGPSHGFALSEFQVLDGDRNLAQGARVTALDSIETGPWASSNLTDGVLATVRPGTDSGALPATMVRRTFTIPGSIRRATVYVTALGLYELRLNGQRVSDHLLAPEWTSYHRHIQYQTYDVTALLRPGDNAVGALVGEGWYAGRLMVVGRFAYGTFPCLLLQLEIELADGRTQTVVTDDSWRSTTHGPIRSSGIYDGEVCDARQEMPGWDTPGFGDRGWNRVQVSERGPAQLVWQPNEPIRVLQELPPVALAQPRPGIQIFDFGQNMVGWCRLTVRGARGTVVTLRHGEMLNADGTLYTANLRGAPQVDRYTLRGGGEEVFEPRFTYHGFRYVEVSGLAQPLTTNSIIGRVVHSSAADTGLFECSDPLITRLMRNITWTQRANLMSTPNDCPQRDERFGWMGDIQSFAQTAIFNMDLAAFFSKWVRDIRDDQAADGRFPDFAPHPGQPSQGFSGAPAWADAGVIVPWRVYENYADARLLEEHFESARRWVEYVHRLNPDLVWSHSRNNDYNDWLNGDWIKRVGWPSQSGSVPKELFATAFFAHSTDLLSKMAVALGREEEAKRYQELFGQIKAAFNQRFVRPDGRMQDDTQAGYALALHFDLLPEPLRSSATGHLVEGIRRYRDHLSTGIQSSHRAMLELTRQGVPDTAWLLLTNRTFPSWLYMIDNGATTIWERWDGYVKGRGFQDPGMNSFNHWAFGAVGEWIWRHVVGLNPDETAPGYRHFVIRPRPGGGVTWARGAYQSIRGRIASEWRLEGRSFALDLTVPPNTSATIHLPVAEGSLVRESGKPLAEAAGVRHLRTEDHHAVLSVESGRYAFQVD